MILPSAIAEVRVLLKAFSFARRRSHSDLSLSVSPSLSLSLSLSLTRASAIQIRMSSSGTLSHQSPSYFIRTCLDVDPGSYLYTSLEFSILTSFLYFIYFINHNK